MMVIRMPAKRGTWSIHVHSFMSQARILCRQKDGVGLTIVYKLEKLAGLRDRHADGILLGLLP